MTLPNLARVVFGTWLLLLFAPLPSRAESQSRPNIIYILADDLGYGDLSCYGQQKFSTPNIDRLASEGIRFTDHYSGATVCAPSRACLMTGKHTGHSTIRGNSGRDAQGKRVSITLQAEDVTLAEILQQAGYRTGLFGKWSLGLEGSPGLPTKQGFDETYGFLNQTYAHNYYPEYIYRNDRKEPIPGNVGGKRNVYISDRFIEEGLGFIDRHVARNQANNADQPFFLYLPLTAPHAELLVPEDSLQEFRGRWPETPFVANGSGAWKGAPRGVYASQATPRAAFAAMITRMDSDVGKILAKLKKMGLDENTIVMFSSDNGPHHEGGADPDFFNSSGKLTGGKRDLYEGGIRVPMLARWPTKIAAGTTTNFPSAFWDILPTCADLAGCDSSAGIDGTSLLPVLLGKNTGNENTENRQRGLYWEFHQRETTKQAARKGPWKAVRHDPNLPLELYNLDSDIAEKKNVADANPSIVAEMENYLRTARSESPYWPLVSKSKRRHRAAKPVIASAEPAFRDLFNGKDLTGWVNVNTSPETWTVRDEMLICTGKPIGVLRTEQQYENFVLQVEWRHMELGGNSGVFFWTDAIPQEKSRLPKGMEVQMLELDWVNQHKKDGVLPPVAYVQGELFGAGGMTAVADNPRGTRSKSFEHRCKGRGEWNKYTVVAIDGVVKLSVNGKFVNGMRDASWKKGYLCLESEGAEIHFRNVRIMELPGGLANESNTAPLLPKATN